MRLIERIRLRFFQKNLLKELSTQNRRRQTHTFWSARSIGLLFDATQEKDRADVLQFVRALEKEGKTVQTLGYVHLKKEPENLPFSFFTRKMTKWFGMPIVEKATSFAKERFDLLLVINSAGQLPLEWIASQSKAAMKIGHATENPNDFDIMLETPAGKSVKFFLDQLDFYLDKIVLAHGHALTKA